jgi:NAD/NADP transhydrogenase beta subunit
MKDHSRTIRQLITFPNIVKMLIVSLLCGFLVFLSMTGTDMLVSSLLHVSGNPAITNGNFLTVLNGIECFIGMCIHSFGDGMQVLQKVL